MIENPRSSLYWRTSFFRPIRRLLRYTAHQACAYGSDRPKWTVLAHNTRTIDSICKTCPGVSKTHRHKPWGVSVAPDNTKVFSTAEETAYPPLLAYTIAFAIAQHLIQKGWKPPSPELVSPDTVSYQYLRAIVGAQPKASKLPPILSEFARIVRVPVSLSCLPVQVGQSLSLPFAGVPAGAKLLRRPPLRINGGFDDNIGGHVNSGLNNGEGNGDNLTHWAYFGIYRSCNDFVEAAVKASHPVSRSNRLPQVLQEAIDVISSRSMFQLAKERHSTLEYWLGRAKALTPLEKKLHDGFPQELGRILSPKRLLLWKEMLCYYGYPDVAVFDEVTAGIHLAGASSAVPAFEPCFKPAKVSVGELAASAKSARSTLLTSIRSSGDDEIDSTVHAKIVEELDCGWLAGPFEISDLPDDAVISRRFGIRQGSGDTSKIRLIDDFSASGVNDTVQVENASKLHTLDIAAAMCLELLRVPGRDQWLGKTFDLASAYRQLGVAPGSYWVSYIAVYNPATKSPQVFAMRALPFGASRSVYGFLRVAHSIWWLGCKALSLAWSNFFDDFITFARSQEADMVSVATVQFFKLLGWGLSLGDKDLPFSNRFKALGVEIDCTRWLDGTVAFANTEKRVQELLATIDAVLSTKTLSKQSALVLRGRMQFAKAQLWGRSANLCLSAVTAHAFGFDGSSPSERTLNFLKIFRAHLTLSRPRVITAGWCLPLFLFTDASFSPEVEHWPAGLGGVLIDAHGIQIAAFSYKLSKDDLASLGYPPKKTVIFEAELLALLVSMFLWKKNLRGRPCVAYIDNNSTRDVSISGTARTFPGCSLVGKLLEIEDSIGMIPWYARVPSQSNVADPPSRGSTEGLTVKLLSQQLVGLVVSKCLRGL